MTPAAVLFDAGGTLVLQDPVEMGERLGMTIDPAAAFDAHYRSMAEFSALKRNGDAGLSWVWFLERYFGLLGHPEPAAAGPVIDNGYLLWRWVIPGVPEAIDRLVASGVRVAVVSNSDGSVTQSLTDAGLAHRFEMIVDSAQVGHAKPQREIFDLTCERMGVEPSRTWFVGDSMHHDVDGALGAGLARAVLVDPLDLHDWADRVEGVADLPDLLG